jgi:hypothetical protein
MREIRTSGSAGAPGGRPPGATQKEREARAGVDRVRPHVGAMSSPEEALRLALSSMPIPRVE